MLQELPDALLEEVVDAADATTRGVLRHVTPRLRAAVDERCRRPAERALHVRQLAAELPLMTWAVDEQGCTLYGNTFAAAAGAGRVEVLRWLAEERRCLSDSRAAVAAARHGHLPALRWLEERGQKFPFRQCLVVAAARGHLHVLEFLAQQRGEDDIRRDKVSQHILKPIY